MYEKFAQMALYYDFYGNLLTDKQREMLALYYEDNLSLGEIAAEYSVSRQAVHDILKRTEKTLAGYEEKLGLVTKFENNKKSLQELVGLCKEIKSNQDINKIDLIIEKVAQIIE